MNGAHLHLISSHIPIVGAGFTLLLFAFAFAKKNNEFKRTALWFAFITGITALLTYLTGDSAEEIITKIPGITESIIEPHENWAVAYLITMSIIGAVALVGLFLSRASAIVLHRFAILIAVLTLLSTAIATETAITGGKIRHTEIHQPSPTTENNSN